MPRYISIVFTKPSSSAREAEFNDWYTNQHVPDVLEVPGIVSCQRFRMLESTRSPFAYRYAAVYELDTDDVPAVMAEVGRRARTDRMPMNDAMSDDRIYLDFEPVSPVITAADVAVQRGRKKGSAD